MTGDMALPPTLAANPRLGDWLRIGPDGTVTVHSGKVELGQGILTALAQMVAEELDIDVNRIRMTATATGFSPDEGIRRAACPFSSRVPHCARSARRRATSTSRWLRRSSPSPRRTLSSTTGRSPVAMARRPAMGVGRRSVLDRPASGGAKPKPESDYHVVGTDVARIDLPDKLSGRPRYVHDLQFDGMLYGRVVRPPSRAAMLTAVDDTPTLALTGVVTVVRDGDFLGVVAEREETALRAADRLRADAVWDQNPSLPDEDDLPRFLTEAPADTTTIARWPRPADAAHPASSATYHRPFIAHGSIAPSGAVAVAREGGWRSGRTARASTTCAGRSRANWECGRSNWWSAMSMAQAVTGTTVPTTLPWTRPCWRSPCRAARFRWCGRAPTSSAGHRSEPRAWSRSAAETANDGAVLSWRHEIWRAAPSAGPA